MSEWTPKKYKRFGITPRFGESLTEEVEEPPKPTFKAIPINNPNVLGDENYRGAKANQPDILAQVQSIIKPGEVQLMPEQTITAKPSNIPLRDIPLTDAQRQIGMKIPLPNKEDVYAEERARIGNALEMITKGKMFEPVYNPIVEGAEQIYKGGKQIVNNAGDILPDLAQLISTEQYPELKSKGETIRGVGNIAGGGFKTILGSLPPVMALNAVQPVITKAAGDIGESLGVKRETAENLANKITPFVFGLPVGIGSLASEETVSLLDQAGAFKSLGEEDQLLAKDLIQNGLFLGIAAKGGKLIKRGKEFRDLIKDNRERSLPFPKGKTPDQILRPRLNQDQLNQGLTEAAPTEKPIDVSKLPTKEKVPTPYEQARERARQRLAEIPEEQKSFFTPEETQRIIDTASKNPEVKSRNLARALGKTLDETTIAEIDKIRESVQKTPEVPKTEQTVDNNRNAAFSLFKDDKSVNDVSKALNISRATAIKYKGEFDKSVKQQKPFKRQYFTPPTEKVEVKSEKPTPTRETISQPSETPIVESIPNKGTYWAIRLNDGKMIYGEKNKYSNHADLVEKKNINPNDLESAGFIVNGKYNTQSREIDRVERIGLITKKGQSVDEMIKQPETATPESTNLQKAPEGQITKDIPPYELSKEDFAKYAAENAPDPQTRFRAQQQIKTGNEDQFVDAYRESLKPEQPTPPNERRVNLKEGEGKSKVADEVVSELQSGLDFIPMNGSAITKYFNDKGNNIKDIYEQLNKDPRLEFAQQGSESVYKLKSSPEPKGEIESDLAEKYKQPTSFISEPEKTTLNLRGTKELTEQSKAGLVENDKLLTQLFQQKEIQNSKTSRPVEKIQASAKAKKIVKELNTKGVKATYDNRNVYIDGKKISSVDLSPRIKVEDVTILNDKATESFEKLSPEEVAKQTALASIVEPKDLDTGLGQKTIDKGLEQIKKDDGQEMQPEALAVRDAALQKEKLGVQIGDTVVKGEELVTQAKEGLKETPELARAKAKLEELQDDVFSTPEEIKKAEEKISQLEKVKPKPQKEESLFEGTKDNAPVFRTDEGIKAGKGAEDTPLFNQPKEDKTQIDAFKENPSKLEIDKWQSRIDKYGKQGIEDLKAYLASKTLGRELGEKAEDYYKRKGLTEFREWAEKKVNEPPSLPEGREPKRIISQESYDTARKNILEKSGNLNAGIDPTLIKDFAFVGAYHLENIVRSGIDKAEHFAEYSKKMIEDFGEKVKPYLKDVWEQMKKEHPELREVFKETKEQKTTGIKNAVVNAEREQIKLSPIEKEAARGREKVWEEAKANIESGQVNPRDFVSSLKERPRSLSDLEDSYVAHDRINLTNERELVSDQLLKAVKDGDDQAQLDVRLRLERVNKDIAENDLVADRTGTETARGLAFRRWLYNNDYSLASIEKQLNVARQGKPLPEEMRTQLESLVKEHEERSKVLEEKLKSAEERVSKLEAEKIIKGVQRQISFENRRAKRQRSSLELVAERKNLYADLYKVTGNLNANPFTSPEAIKVIGQIAKNYLETGINTAEGIVDAIYNDVKDKIEGITPRDIRDAITGYGRQKEGKTINELNAHLRDIKNQLTLISKIEDAQSGKRPLKARFEKKQPNETLQKLRKELNAIIKDRGLKEELSDAKKLEAYKKRIVAQRIQIEDRIQSGKYEKEKKEPLQLDQEAIDAKAQLLQTQKKLKRLIDIEKYHNRTGAEKAKDWFTEIINLPRSAFMTVADFSAPLRQGLILGARRPIMSATKVLPESMKAMFSPKTYDAIEAKIALSPNKKYYDRFSLEITEAHGEPFNLGKREEIYMSTLAENMPVFRNLKNHTLQNILNVPSKVYNKTWGEVVKASERGFTAYMNLLRTSSFDEIIKAFDKNGYDINNPVNNKLYTDLAKFVNTASLRGSLGKLDKMAPMLNGVIFSPRNLVSRLQLLNPVYYYKMEKPVRVEALKSMASMVGAGLTVLSLAKLAGADVETDPRSTDFGKIKLGNTRVDIWGGFQQFARYFAVMITKETKSTAGKVRELSAKEFPFTTRADVTQKFFENKLSPQASLLWSALKGKNNVGEDFDITDEAIQRMIPLAISDSYQAIDELGWLKGGALAVPAAFGAGMQTYTPKKKKGSYTPWKR